MTVWRIFFVTWKLWGSLAAQLLNLTTMAIYACNAPHWLTDICCFPHCI